MSDDDTIDDRTWRHLARRLRAAAAVERDKVKRLQLLYFAEDCDEAGAGSTPWDGRRRPDVSLGRDGWSRETGGLELGAVIARIRERAN